MLWRLGEIRTVSRIVRKTTNARAHTNAMEMAEKIANVP
jgi:hypothetical protein